MAHALHRSRKMNRRWTDVATVIGNARGMVADRLTKSCQGEEVHVYGNNAEHMNVLMELLQRNCVTKAFHVVPSNILPTATYPTPCRIPIRSIHFNNSRLTFAIQSCSPRFSYGLRPFSGIASVSCNASADGSSGFYGSGKGCERDEDFLGTCSYVQPPGDRVDAAEKLQEEFETAMKCFEEVPECLDDMPKINPNGVYANHNLRLDLINVYGFDYDYTLAHYTVNLQPLIYNLAKEQLVKHQKYPETCLKFEYDPDFPIRGLYYDRKRSYLLKLDFFHCVEVASCFFGRRRLSRAEIERAYGGKHISFENMHHLVPLMDLFCLSEVCLLSDVIQHFVDEGLEFDPGYVYEDVKRSVEDVHRSGLLHKLILEQPDKYLVRNEAVAQMLRMLKEKGKKTFILTNSPFPFVDGGMRYLFQGDGVDGTSWRELFDVVVALSDKPNFYTSERPFRHYDTSKDRLAFSRVDKFKPHDVYYHGCLKDFLNITKWRGTEVLYFGDHLFSDLRGPAKAGWRTAAIIRELEREIAAQNENEYRIQQARYHMVQELLGKYHGLPVGPRRDKEKCLLLALRKERQNARLAMSHMFNSYFGSTFLTDTGKESAFAYNVQKYADVYTSRLENMMTYSSEAWLYTPFDVKILPHQIKVGPSKIFKNWPFATYQA